MFLKSRQDKFNVTVKRVKININELKENNL